MEERRIDRQRYWLAHFFEDMPVGTQFKPGVLHITVLTWFVIDVEEAELLKSFTSRFAGTKSFEVKVGELAKFGPKKDVLVGLIEPNEQIRDLHERALNLMDEVKGSWAVKDPHSGADYVPHLRYREDSKLANGKTLRVDSLSLIKAQRREDGQRTVVAKVVFDE